MADDIRRIIELYLDVERSYVVDSTNTRVKENPRVFRGSEFIFQVHLMKGTATFKPDPGSSWYFVIGETFSATVSTALVTSLNDQFNITGDWASLNVADGAISLRVNTSSDELKAALGTSGMKEMYAELWYTAPGGTLSLLCQFRINVYNIIADGNTTFAVPTYSSGILKYDTNGDILLCRQDGSIAQRWS